MKWALGYWILGITLLAGGGWLLCPDGQCRPSSLDRAGLELAHVLAHVTAGPVIDRFMVLITWFGSLWLLLPLCCLAGLGLCYWGRPRQAVFLLAALLGATAMAQVFKFWFARPRPDLFAATAPMPLDASYPSAHTMQAVAVALALALLVGRQRPWLASLLLIVAALVSWSRIHLQVHFPTDVIAGVCAAVLWVVGLHAWLRPAADPARKRD
jgi:membrane-associated phospholipid phosphatase